MRGRDPRIFQRITLIVIPAKAGIQLHPFTA
jgi:hypothetical protein